MWLSAGVENLHTADDDLLDSIAFGDWPDTDSFSSWILDLSKTTSLWTISDGYEALVKWYSISISSAYMSRYLFKCLRYLRNLPYKDKNIAGVAGALYISTVLTVLTKNLSQEAIWKQVLDELRNLMEKEANTDEQQPHFYFSYLRRAYDSGTFDKNLLWKFQRWAETNQDWRLQRKGLELTVFILMSQVPWSKGIGESLLLVHTSMDRILTKGREMTSFATRFDRTLDRMQSKLKNVNYEYVRKCFPSIMLK